MAKTINQQKIQELEQIKDNWVEAKRKLEELQETLMQKEIQLKSERQKHIEAGRTPIKANELTSESFAEVKQLRDEVKRVKSQIESYKDQYKTLEKWSDSVRFYLTFKNLYDRGNNSYWKLKKLMGLGGRTIYRDIFYVYINAIINKVGDFKKAVQEVIYHNWSVEDFIELHKNAEVKINIIKEELNVKVSTISNDEEAKELERQFLEKMKETLKKEAEAHIKV